MHNPISDNDSIRIPAADSIPYSFQPLVLGDSFQDIFFDYNIRTVVRVILNCISQPVTLRFIPASIRRHPVEHLRDGAHVLRRERSVLTPARALGELLEGLRQFLEELANLLKQAVLVVIQTAHELLVRQHRRCGVGHDFLTRHVLGVAERVHLVLDQIVHILPIHKC